jgi:hypothetical protein
MKLIVWPTGQSKLNALRSNLPPFERVLAVLRLRLAAIEHSTAVGRLFWASKNDLDLLLCFRNDPYSRESRYAR